MTVFIDHHAVGRVLTYRDCVNLLEEVFRHEAAGETVVSPRLASSFRHGGMRILFAAVGLNTLTRAMRQTLARHSSWARAW